MLIKYPRTRHLEGSRLQPGDEDLSQVRLGDLAGHHLVVEEKMDGANAGIRFDGPDHLLLQSRGHFLTGGYRERHFDLFKAWAARHRTALWNIMGNRYLMFGEWLYAKHTIFYDALPHYFLEFDIFDLERHHFLDTPSRKALIAGSPVVSVPVLTEVDIDSRTRTDTLTKWIGYSNAKSPNWRTRLKEVAAREGLEPHRIESETDPSDLMEGLYFKVEAEGKVTDRLKWVRADFLTTVTDSGSHWLDRPILPNQLAQGVDLFGCDGPFGEVTP
ncbi:RNA ligase family protein [Sulfidibacter corallicola]